MSRKYNTPTREIPESKTFNGPDNTFVFSSDISKWMPNIKKTPYPKPKKGLNAVRVGTKGFRRANDSMLCSERRIVK